MSAAAKLGLELGSCGDLRSALMQARSENFDFVIVPLVHPRKRSDSLGISSQRDEFCQWTRSDLVLSTTEWSRGVVGSVSRWPWRLLGSFAGGGGDGGAAAAEAAVIRELEWASHLGLSATIAPLMAERMRNVVAGARLINQILQRASSWQLWLRCRVEDWEAWDATRRLCDHALGLCVALQLGSEIPVDAARRWRGEPIKAVVIPARLFLSNEAGFPVLAKAHQSFVASLAELMDPHAHVIISGRLKHERGRIVYVQYVHHILSKLRRVRTPAEDAEVPYRDFLQAPLQPLADNLEAQTYETFERDPIKYAKYQEATLKFLRGWRGSEPPVVAVVGAGRGPLVARALAAAEEAGIVLEHLYAVEKNPNALVTLRARAKTPEWRRVVTVCAGDMRSLRLPKLADCIISELLGSFGDNELSPECLDGAFATLARRGAVSIPERYQSFAQPVSAARLWFDARRANTAELPGPPPALTIPGAPPPARGLETAFVVKLHRFAPLADSEPCFEFHHGASGRPAAGDDDDEKSPSFRSNARSVSLLFEMSVDATVHGLAGYFEAQLFDDVTLSIHPPTFSTGMFSWFPLFIPFLHPVALKRNEILRVDLWRRTDESRVWYEWAVVSPQVYPIQNPNGRSYVIKK